MYDDFIHSNPMKLGYYYLVKVTDSGRSGPIASNVCVWYKGERTQFYSLDEVRETIGDHYVLETLEPDESSAVFCAGFRIIKRLGWFF